jgi:hypothetical protein
MASKRTEEFDLEERKLGTTADILMWSKSLWDWECGLVLEPSD